VSFGKRLLAALVVGAAFSSAGAGLGAAPALATNEYNKCKHCSAINGPKDNWVKNVESHNLSGGGLWNILWKKFSTGYSTIWEKKYPTALGALVCNEAELPEAHGETRRYYTKYLYTLSVRQTNYAACEWLEPEPEREIE
jgi:hypothetical protein